MRSKPDHKFERGRRQRPQFPFCTSRGPPLVWPLMSIATKTGDAGTTGLMYNRRVPKSHPRVEAYGSVDEVNTAIGMARALATEDFVRGHLLPIQADLVVLMGELATEAGDLERYVKDGFQLVTPAMTVKLDEVVREIEGQQISFKGWA